MQIVEMQIVEIQKVEMQIVEMDANSSGKGKMDSPFLLTFDHFSIYQ